LRQKASGLIFTLDFLRDIELRRRIQAGLNKGEDSKCLARAVFFNRLGEPARTNSTGQMPGAWLLPRALHLNRRLLYYFSWTKLYFVAFNSQWQSASEVDWALPLAREEVVRPCTDQAALWAVYDLSAVPGAN